MFARQLPSFVRRHRSLRWAVPAAVAAIIGLVAGGVFSSAAPTGPLPSTTAAQLLAQVSSQTVTGFSGTVVSHVALGLPDLPSIDDIAGDSPLADLLTGSRTLEVWYGGPDQQRIALLGSTDETDLFRSGRTLWRWDSSDRTADRVRLARKKAAAPSPLTTLTPAGLASSALKTMQPTTEVSVEDGDEVADRAAYELVLRPRSDATRIGEVRIAVDGQTKIPLGVQIYPRGSSTAAVDVSYTSIRYAAPSTTNFDFEPPADAHVRHLSLHKLSEQDGLSLARFGVGGGDWSAVLTYDSHRTVHTHGLGLGRALTRVSGTWGHGRLLETSLFCVLLTHDGRVYIGAVDPTALYTAAERK